MAIGGRLKHIFWILAVSEQQMPARFAVALGLGESFFEGLNTLLLMHSFPLTGSMFLEQPLQGPSESF